MRLEDFPTEPSYSAVVLATEELTEEGSDVEIREIVLEVQNQKFEFELGQSIGVLVEAAGDAGGRERHRLYTLADTPQPGGNAEITIVVRRCSYIDDYSGEEHIGVNSHYLCDRKPGDVITITGPFGNPFPVPPDKRANLFLIGLGTGIAPFRALVKHIYQDVGDWQGKVRLLYGAHSGLELLYMNDKRDDFTNYYDQETFEAFKAVSPRPSWADPIGWDYAVEERADEIIELLSDEHTYVYVAGQEAISDTLDRLFGRMYESNKAFMQRKSDLMQAGRWMELLY